MAKTINDELIIHTYSEINKNIDSGDKLISKDIIRDVIDNGQFKFVKEVIERGMFEDVGLKYFGKFKADHNKIRRLYNKNKSNKIISYGKKKNKKG
jgi:hypothetical protein